MRKLVILAAAALPLAACATSPYGSSPYGYGNNPLGAILGSVGSVGSNYGGYGYNNNGFSQAAVNACANYASRYGRVGISNVRQVSSSSMKVYGSVSDGYRSNNWDCTFRSDGRITDFDL